MDSGPGGGLGTKTPAAALGWRSYIPGPRMSVALAVVAGFVGAVVYDRREARAEMDKSCARVRALANAPLQPLEMPRKVRIVLTAPPGDDVYAAQEHFSRYVKPVLNAAAVDFELVQGKTEGELRYKIAEQIRQLRRGHVDDADNPLLQAVKKSVRPSSEWGGNVVIGRQAWKEYVQGLHEGWLGPLECEAKDTPAQPSGPAAEQDGSQGAQQSLRATERPSSQVTKDFSTETRLLTCRQGGHAGRPGKRGGGHAAAARRGCGQRSRGDQAQAGV